MPPTCPICNTQMVFIYKDLTKRKSVYKCRRCGYREEEYEVDGTEEPKQVE